MGGCESWTIKTAECWRTDDSFELCCWRRLLRESLGLQGDQTSQSKGNQAWIFIARTDAEAEVPILRPPDVKNWLIGKDPDAGKDWGQEEKGMPEGEMVGCHHWLNGHEFEQTPGHSGEQGSLVYCSPWGYKELDTTEQLNNKSIGLRMNVGLRMNIGLRILTITHPQFSSVQSLSHVCFLP